MKLFGHINRHDSSENATLEGQEPGNRSRGKPRRRWQDCIGKRLDYTMISTGLRYVSSDRIFRYVRPEV